jgi:hypothetical protein
MAASDCLSSIRGVFPVISYLHVPGKMKAPQWLMMGTCFALSMGSIGVRAEKSKVFFLTSAHTFLPWAHMKSAAELKIPLEFRKPRFVIGRVFLPMGHLDGSRAVERRLWYSAALSAVHPSLDVALLSATAAAPPASGAALLPSSAQTLELAARHFDWWQEYSLDASDPAEGAAVETLGFRGLGVLGEIDTLDATLLQTLSKPQQDALVQELREVEGKQQLTVASGAVARRGVAVITAGRCWNGMSGAPFVINGRTASACGVLYGNCAEVDSLHGNEQCIGFIPSSAVVSWIRGILGATEPS